MNQKVYIWMLMTRHGEGTPIGVYANKVALYKDIYRRLPGLSFMHIDPKRPSGILVRSKKGETYLCWIVTMELQS